MSEIRLSSPLVSVTWLHENLDADNLVILDASLPKAGLGEETLTDLSIPGARFMDLKNRWADREATFPNTMLRPEEFQKEARKLGICRNSAVVVYDQHGIYSSARAWFMLRSMGHDEVAVLDGGLPAWQNAGYEVGPKTAFSGPEGNFAAYPRTGFFVDHQMVLRELESDSFLVLDARARDRFLGLVKEPREGLRSGHIPHSRSLPYSDLQKGGHMKDPHALEALFSGFCPRDQSMVFSCGSGITACVLALGAELAGRPVGAVFDGSWTEWGSRHELPIEK
jgi:thiosulfate/3-mercaptopyruvate sulfurtransferase